MLSSFRSLGNLLRLLPWLHLLLTVASLDAAAPTPFPPPSSAGQLFEERGFGPLPLPTQTPPPPKRFDSEEEKPIPREWIMAGLATVALAVAGIIYGSARAWRSSNIFDQQYRFPANEHPALRFGGPRGGGHMATIRLNAKTQRQRDQASETKDA